MMQRHLIAAASCILLCLGSLAHAQGEHSTRKELIEAGLEPELFQSQLRYLMGASSGTVQIQQTCPEELPPLWVCMEPPPPPFNFRHENLGHVTLPGNSTRSALVFMSTTRVDYQLRNLNLGPPDPNPNPLPLELNRARFTVQPFATIESEALNDPRAVDEDGAPLLGSLSVGTRVHFEKWMIPGESLRQSLFGLNRMFVVTKGSIRSTGLPEDIVDRLLKGPVTNRLGLTGTAEAATAETIQFTVRVFGN